MVHFSVVTWQGQPPPKRILDEGSEHKEGATMVLGVVVARLKGFRTTEIAELKIASFCKGVGCDLEENFQSPWHRIWCGIHMQHCENLQIPS